MTKAELLKKLENVPDDTELIITGGNRETGHIYQKLNYVSDPEHWEPTERTFINAFDFNRYNKTVWVPSNEKKLKSIKVVVIR